MARARKKHIQQSLEFRTHGGKRAGAGRPPKHERSSEPHKKREQVDARHPLHVVTRVAEDIGSLRKRDLYRAICDATVSAFEKGSAKAAAAVGTNNLGPSETAHAMRVAGFRIVHASVQRNHLHLLVEATDKDSLADGIQGFLSSAAQRINRAVSRRGTRRRGCVFTDRYYAVPLKTPRQVRNCLAYVLNNWRRHGEDREWRWNVDPFSTGIWFPGWKERAAVPVLFTPPPNYVWMMTWLPKTWLLREGWKLHPLVSLREVPGSLDDRHRIRGT